MERDPSCQGKGIPALLQEPSPLYEGRPAINWKGTTLGGLPAPREPCVP